MRKVDFRVIKQLWLFQAVAEELHFGRAAKRLGMSQPPLTEQIKLLEHALGLTLLERSRQGTMLSPAGNAILPTIKKFMQQVENFEFNVKEIAKGQTGVLHIGAITSAMFESIPSLVSILKKHYPNITIKVEEIDSVEAIPMLENGDIDIAFARLEGNVSSHIAFSPMEEDRLIAALPKKHPLASRNSISLSDLQNEQLVMSSRKVSPIYFDTLVSKCREFDLNMNIVHEVRSVASQLAYVSCEQGIALVPASMQKVAPENVSILPLEEEISLVTSAAAWNTTRFNPIVEFAVAALNQSESNG